VLSCVQVEALRRADPPSKEFYQLSNRFIKLKKITSEPEQSLKADDDDDDDDDAVNDQVEHTN
jgi:hypothetical protein